MIWRIKEMNIELGNNRKNASLQTTRRLSSLDTGTLVEKREPSFDIRLWLTSRKLEKLGSDCVKTGAANCTRQRNGY